MTRSEFGQGIAFLSAATGRKVPVETIEVWYLVAQQQQLTAQEWQSGVAAVVASHEFSGLPAIGSIIKAARASSGRAALAVEDQAAVAWGKVLDAIREHGAYRTVQFDDAAISPTIRDLGGWVTVCDTPRDELIRFVRPTFAKLYAAHARAGTSSKSPALAGLLAADASRRGYALPSPVDAATGAPLLAIDPPPRERQPVANLAGKVGTMPLVAKPQPKPAKPSHDRAEAKQQLADWQASKGSADATPPADRRRKNKPASPADSHNPGDAA